MFFIYIIVIYTFLSFHVIQLCNKASFGNMICPFPNLKRAITDDLNAKISLYLDAVTTWVDLAGYPKFNSITIVPNPIIDKFPDDVFVLKDTTLKIKVGITYTLI